MIQSTTSQRQKWYSRPLFRWSVVLILLFIACVTALGWLGIVKTEGRETLSDTADLRNVQTVDLTTSLTRNGYASEGTSVDVILASNTFFQITNRPQEAVKMGADRYLVFVANETVHSGVLPKQFSPIVRIDGNSLHVPSQVSVMSDSEHHRTTVVTYADIPQSLLNEEHIVAVLLPEMPSGKRNILEWGTPIDYPDSVEAPQTISLPLILSLGAGLLAAISPCLLQLTAFYLPTLAGVSMDAELEGDSQSRKRLRVMLTALVFVLGFTIPYTVGGALIGGMGQALSASGLLSPTGPIVVGSGAVMIIMSILVAYRARAPLVCHMPMPRALKQNRRLAFLETFISGFAIATGCLSCFGSAILAVLLVYTGLLGSAWMGGLSMFLFSLGIAIPFLLSAFSLSWIMPLAQRLQKFTPMIGLVSAIVMLFFGIVMVSGNFHIVSGLLARMMPLR